jgi:hypothetical protein
MSENNDSLKEMIALWKQLNILDCVMDFDCGGDSMNDYSFTFWKKNENNRREEVVDGEEPLREYIEDAVFRNVNFYEASDGHYQGEHGTVTITLDDDVEGEEDFVYEKKSRSEYNETQEDEVEVEELTEEQKALLIDKIEYMGSGHQGNLTRYSKDCFLSDEEEEMIDEIWDLFDRTAEDYDDYDLNSQYDEVDENDTIQWEFDKKEHLRSDDTVYLKVEKEFTCYKED